MSSVIYQQTINPHDLFYQCSKDGPEFLFGKLSIRGYRDDPYFTAKIKLFSCQIQMNRLFNNYYGRKRGRFYRNIHKSVRIPVDVYQTDERLFATVQPKNHLNWNL